ncbi:MAG: hypothetical protein QM729_00560 [Solirubrobacterales bacterium]
MALSDEQNAMLRLLASGEQGYEDIAALLGQSVDEVRAKVVGALAQLQAEGKPAPDIPPPLPGGAHPAAEAAAPEPEPVPEPSEEEPPAEPVIADSVAPSEPTPPAEPKPAAPKPPAAGPQPQAAASPPPSDPTSSGGRTITLPTGRKAWMLGGGVVGAIVVIVVVILLLSGGGGGDGSSTGAKEGGSGSTANAKSEGEAEKEATQAQLHAVDGSEASGQATFGRYKKKLALAIEATGLEPTEEGTTSYTVWLAKSPTKMLPLFSTSVKAKGESADTIAGEYEVPVEILSYLAGETFDQIAVTLTNNDKLEASIKAAKKEKSTPAYTGTAVLRGQVTGPIVGYAIREEEEKKEESGE